MKRKAFRYQYQEHSIYDILDYLEDSGYYFRLKSRRGGYVKLIYKIIGLNLYIEHPFLKNYDNDRERWKEINEPIVDSSMLRNKWIKYLKSIFEGKSITEIHQTQTREEGLLYKRLKRKFDKVDDTLGYDLKDEERIRKDLEMTDWQIRKYNAKQMTLFLLDYIKRRFKLLFK